MAIEGEPIKWRAECEDGLKVIVLHRLEDGSWSAYSEAEGPERARTFDADTPARSCALWVARRWSLIALLEPGQRPRREVEQDLEFARITLSQLKESVADALETLGGKLDEFKARRETGKLSEADFGKSVAYEKAIKVVRSAIGDDQEENTEAGST